MIRDHAMIDAKLQDFMGQIDRLAAQTELDETQQTLSQEALDLAHFYANTEIQLEADHEQRQTDNH